MTKKKADPTPDLFAAERDDEVAALMLTAHKYMLAMDKQLASLREVLNAIQAKTVRRAKDLDDAGEPTFRFLARVSIPKEMFLTNKLLNYGAEHGFSDAETKRLFGGSEAYEGFYRYYSRAGTKWQDWSAVWMRWVRIEAQRRDEKPALVARPDHRSI